MTQVIPRLVLICCEGSQTEPSFFNLLKKVRRIRSGIKAVVFGGKGQHKQLIDYCVKERERILTEKLVREQEIEIWAVCDGDKMSCSLKELIEYAVARKVMLGFCDPQFETYLLQYFGLSQTVIKQKELVAKLTKVIKRCGLADQYDKNNLTWLETMIDQDPSIVEAANKNAEKMCDPEERPYLTVQKLVARLLEAELR